MFGRSRRPWGSSRLGLSPPTLQWPGVPGILGSSRLTKYEEMFRVWVYEERGFVYFLSKIRLLLRFTMTITFSFREWSSVFWNSLYHSFPSGTERNFTKFYVSCVEESKRVRQRLSCVTSLIRGMFRKKTLHRRKNKMGLTSFRNKIYRVPSHLCENFIWKFISNVILNVLYNDLFFRTHHDFTVV